MLICRMCQSQYNNQSQIIQNPKIRLNRQSLQCDWSSVFLQIAKCYTSHFEQHTGQDFNQIAVYAALWTRSMLHSSEQCRRKHSWGSVPLWRGRDGQPHATTSKTNSFGLFPERTHTHTRKTQTNTPLHQTDRQANTSDKDIDDHILTGTDTLTLCPVNSLDMFKAA